MFALKYICAIIAVFCTLLFVSNIITNMTSSQVIFSKDDNVTNNNMYYAALRLILILIMSITWPLVFML